MIEATEGRILERGYRRYHGPREGVGHAMRSTMAHTIRHVMGLHRPARYKLLPFSTLIICYFPAIVFVGATAFLPDEARGFIPSEDDYYGFLSRVLILYASIVIPDAICADRRSRSLSLYFSSALNRVTYLAAKFLAIMSCLLMATVGPVLLVLLGFAIQGAGPDGVLGFLGSFGRVLSAGVVVALAYTALGMGMSTITDRRGFATAAIFLTILFSTVFSNMLVLLIDLPKSFYLVDFGRAQYEAVRAIFGKPPIDFNPAFSIGNEWWPILAAEVLWIGLPLAFCMQRYRKGRVTR